MMEISANTQAIAYLVSAVLFIFALKGLTHPASARRGNYYGMAGMGIAIVATFGMAAAIYIGLIGTAAALTILVLLCLGDTKMS